MPTYDRRQAADSPANVLKNTARALHTVDHDLVRAEAAVKGLHSQLAMMARSTHDRHVQDNFKRVTALKERFEKFHKEAKALASEFDLGSKDYQG